MDWATDEAEEVVWLWVDSTPVEGARWGPGDPNNINRREDYASFGHHGSGQWYDTTVDAEGVHGFVCEWD